MIGSCLFCIVYIPRLHMFGSGSQGTSSNGIDLVLLEAGFHTGGIKFSCVTLRPCHFDVWPSALSYPFIEMSSSNKIDCSVRWHYPDTCLVYLFKQWTLDVTLVYCIWVRCLKVWSQNFAWVDLAMNTFNVLTLYILFWWPGDTSSWLTNNHSIDLTENKRLSNWQHCTQWWRCKSS